MYLSRRLYNASSIALDRSVAVSIQTLRTTFRFLAPKKYCNALLKLVKHLRYIIYDSRNNY